jgi:alpha-L-fucosidase
VKGLTTTRVIKLPVSLRVVMKTSLRRFVPLLVVMSLMFFWNMCRNVNDVLIPHMKRAFRLSDLQSSLVQSAFFGAYFLASIPAGIYIRRKGYKAGMVSGLLMAAVGAALFYPAAEIRYYPLFLGALFIMASGFTFLEVTATPYISSFGDPKEASSRLSLSAAAGSIGSTIAPYIGSLFLLHNRDIQLAEIDSWSAGKLQAFLTSEAHLVERPYVFLALLFLIIALALVFLKLPEGDREGSARYSFKNILQFPHALRGVFAVFCYVGAEVGIVSFLIRYSKSQNLPGLTEKKAALFISVFMALVLAGRLLGSYLLKKASSPRMLMISAGGAFLLVFSAFSTQGYFSIWCLALVGLFTSIMYPIIFTLSIKDLGNYTKTASSLLIMGVVGGAVLPPIMGFISDRAGIRWAFIAPMACYVYVAFYAVKGHVVKRKPLVAVLTLSSVFFCTPAFSQQSPRPTALQVSWQQMETTAFLHFSINTFTGKEWGDGSEDPHLFNPSKFDARQWIRALKEAGFRMAIITAKHHDGFCLWPSAYTDHSVKSSPWKNGHGDVVKEVADACREYGVKFGVYLSPWDRHEKTYGTPAYNDYYKHQLRELLTNYGPISEVWFDGAKGPNQKDMAYDFDGYWKLVKELQPNAVIFSDIGPDVRWVGNEKGNAGDTCWSTINTDDMWPGKAKPAYLHTGDANGTQWLPAETDVSIRKGWFWRASEDNTVRSPANIVNLYYQSVGRNSLLLLNIPPNNDGLLDSTDIQAIKGFHTILTESFAKNLFYKHVAKTLTDHDLRTYLTLATGEPLVIDLKSAKTFDRIMLQENIYDGQNIGQGLWEYWDGANWKEIARFSTVGYKRLLRFAPVTTSKVRLTILHAKNQTIELSEIGLFKASDKEKF